MNFASFSDFIYMDGHGLYVWLAYGSGFAVLFYNLVSPFLKRSALLKRLSQQLKREKLSK